MKTYTDIDMVKPKDIIEINKQLSKLGSKVSEKFLDGEEHSLANILHLACGESSYGISIQDINSIQSANFRIDCKCKDTIK